MRPDEEDAIWGELKRKQNKLALGSPSVGLLADRFPELITAGGGVDPQEAIVTLLDRIAELEARLNGIAGISEDS